MTRRPVLALLVPLSCGLLVVGCASRNAHPAAAAGCRTASPSPSAGPVTGERVRADTPPREHLEPDIRGRDTDEAAGMVGPCEAWAVGENDKYLHWTDGAITAVAQPAPSWVPHEAVGEVTAMSATGPEDVWSVGTYSPSLSGGLNPKVDHYDGRRWQPLRLPAQEDEYEVTAVAATGHGTAWILADGDPGSDWFTPGKPTALLLRWDGHAWHRYQVPVPVTSTVGSPTLSAAGPDDVWFGAEVQADPVSDLLMHWDGKRWRQVPFPTTVDTPAVLADGAGGVWVTAGGASTLDSRGVEVRGADSPVLIHRDRAGRVTTVPAPPAPPGWWARYPVRDGTQPRHVGYVECTLGDFFREPGTDRARLVEQCVTEEDKAHVDVEKHDYRRGVGTLVLTLG